MIEEELKYIEDHFNSLSANELTDRLIKCGLEIPVCKYCGTKAVLTNTQGYYRVECISDCSYTFGHKESKNAIKDWIESNE